MASYAQAYAALPTDAEWSCSFGYPGQGGFVDRFRTPDGQRWEVTNGAWDDGRNWKCQPVGIAGEVLAAFDWGQRWLEPSFPLIWFTGTEVLHHALR